MNTSNLIKDLSHIKEVASMISMCALSQSFGDFNGRRQFCLLAKALDRPAASPITVKSGSWFNAEKSFLMV